MRKALEIPLALWINLVLPKRRILEIYLNIVEWGPNGEFGAEAGARWAFGKPARDLTAREAAELAAILPNPVRRSARAPSALVRRLAGLYERRAAAHPALDACIRSRAPDFTGVDRPAGRNKILNGAARRGGTFHFCRADNAAPRARAQP